MGAVSQAQLHPVPPPTPPGLEILDGLGLGMLVLDTHWKVTYANAAASRVWGMDAAAVLGRDLFEAVPAWN